MEAAPKIPEQALSYEELEKRLEALSTENEELRENRARERELVKHVRDMALQRINHDPVTLLENRGVFDRYLEGLERRVERSKEDENRTPVISFMIIDIDHFKNVNDTHGHAAGDEVLQSVSSIVMNSVRASDRSFRYGGEEIVVVCEDTTIEEARILAERVRKNVEEMKLNVETKNGGTAALEITVSVGVAELDPTTENSVKDVFKRADGAMYEAKGGGRNSVEVA